MVNCQLLLGKIKNDAHFAKLSMSRIKSYIGGGLFTGTLTISAFKLATLVLASSGKVTSSQPTFVVIKVLLDILYFCGAKCSLYKIKEFVPSWTNSKSRFDPMFSRTFKTLSLSGLCYVIYNLPITQVTNPLP